MRVFDGHVHMQPWRMLHPQALSLLKGSRPDSQRLERMMYDSGEFVRFLDEQRIERVCNINYVAPEVMGFTPEVNLYAAEYARPYPDRIVPFGSVHPLHSKDPGGDVSKARDMGIRGIKIHPSHQLFYPNAYRNGLDALARVYERAQELGMVVMIHTGTSVFPGARNVYADPIYVDDVAIDFPKLKIVVAHGGRPLWMTTAVFLARRFPNVWIDLSSIPPQNLLSYFPKLEEMADRFLFGSDWPGPGVPGMRENADRFASLPLSEQAKRKILYDNAAALYRMD